jgi:hypothetical protein
MNGYGRDEGGSGSSLFQNSARNGRNKVTKHFSQHFRSPFRIALESESVASPLFASLGLLMTIPWLATVSITALYRAGPEFKSMSGGRLLDLRLSRCPPLAPEKFCHVSLK